MSCSTAASLQAAHTSCRSCRMSSSSAGHCQAAGPANTYNSRLPASARGSTNRKQPTHKQVGGQSWRAALGAAAPSPTPPVAVEQPGRLEVRLVVVQSADAGAAGQRAGVERVVHLACSGKCGHLRGGERARADRSACWPAGRGTALLPQHVTKQPAHQCSQGSRRWGAGVAARRPPLAAPPVPPPPPPPGRPACGKCTAVFRALTTLLGGPAVRSQWVGRISRRQAHPPPPTTRLDRVGACSPLRPQLATDTIHCRLCLCRRGCSAIRLLWRACDCMVAARSSLCGPPKISVPSLNR